VLVVVELNGRKAHGAVSAPVVTVLGATSEVVEAVGATGALKQLSNGRPFDVVVVECAHRSDHAPCVRLIQAMFQRWPWMPVVLIGDTPMERLKADVLLTGVRDFLTPGVAVRRLVRAIARVARRRGTRVPSARSVARIRAIFAFLDDHIAESPSLRELARMTAMSRSHFSRLFHSVAGMPLRGYVRELRLKRAHALLVAGKLSLTAVAVESGFYDLPHFDKAFRRRLGTSPRTFRARSATRRVDA